MIHRIALVEWWPGDGIANAMCRELTGLGFEPVLFPYNGCIPNNVDMVLTFAPYNTLLPVASQMERFDSQKRPIFVHWQTQNLPNPNIPWMFTKSIARFRSWIGQLSYSPRPVDQFLANMKPARWLGERMYRFRYTGDNQYTYHKGWTDILVHSSVIFTQQDIARGLPAVYVPWGTSPEWYEDLRLDRDIDVLWFGKRRTKRRSHLLDTVRQELRKQGVEMYIVDGEERPFIFGDERTQLLNRSKIVLNLGIHPHDNVFTYRFQVVAGNRSLVISETELNHHPQCVAGKHFVAAKADEIAEKIVYYLRHDDARNQITENAYQLVTRELTMAHSLEAVVSAAESRLASSRISDVSPHRLEAFVTHS